MLLDDLQSLSSRSAIPMSVNYPFVHPNYRYFYPSRPYCAAEHVAQAVDRCVWYGGLAAIRGEGRDKWPAAGGEGRGVVGAWRIGKL